MGLLPSLIAFGCSGCFCGQCPEARVGGWLLGDEAAGLPCGEQMVNGAPQVPHPHQATGREMTLPSKQPDTPSVLPSCPQSITRERSCPPSTWERGRGLNPAWTSAHFPPL